MDILDSLCIAWSDFVVDDLCALGSLLDILTFLYWFHKRSIVRAIAKQKEHKAIVYLLSGEPAARELAVTTPLQPSAVVTSAPKRSGSQGGVFSEEERAKRSCFRRTVRVVDYG